MGLRPGLLVLLVAVAGCSSPSSSPQEGPAVPAIADLYRTCQDAEGGQVLDCTQPLGYSLFGPEPPSGWRCHSDYQSGSYKVRLLRNEDDWGLHVLSPGAQVGYLEFHAEANKGLVGLSFEAAAFVELGRLEGPSLEFALDTYVVHLAQEPEFVRDAGIQLFRGDPGVWFVQRVADSQGVGYLSFTRGHPDGSVGAGIGESRWLMENGTISVTVRPVIGLRHGFPLEHGPLDDIGPEPC